MTHAPSLGQKPDSDRNRAIVAAYRNEENTVDIADSFGITRQRVEQIARAAGLPHRHPDKRPGKAVGRAPGVGSPAVSRTKNAPGRGYVGRDSASEALPPVIDRSPCWRCGTRADIGCAHQQGQA